MITVRFKYFGAFRDLDPKGVIDEMKFEAPVSLVELKTELSRRFEHQSLGGFASRLVADSAIASETEVLPKNHCVNQDCTLLLLPPVCGG